MANGVKRTSDIQRQCRLRVSLERYLRAPLQRPAPGRTIGRESSSSQHKCSARPSTVAWQGKSHPSCCAAACSCAGWMPAKRRRQSLAWKMDQTQRAGDRRGIRRRFRGTPLRRFGATNDTQSRTRRPSSIRSYAARLIPEFEIGVHQLVTVDLLGAQPMLQPCVQLTRYPQRRTVTGAMRDRLFQEIEVERSIRNLGHQFIVVSHAPTSHHLAEFVCDVLRHFTAHQGA